VQDIVIGFKNWRLGSDTEPGWFNLEDQETQHGQWFMSTVFRLKWDPCTFKQEGIHNCLHAVTVGRKGRAGKIHLENLAQILHGGLHITCRIQDSAGRIERHTMPLPEDKEYYNHRRLLLLYASTGSGPEKQRAKTHSVLYDCDTLKLLQNLAWTAPVACAEDLDFGSWPQQRVICDFEQNHRACDHVMVHGHAGDSASAQFELDRVWGTLGATLDPLDPSTIHSLLQTTVADKIGNINAWYNCWQDRTVWWKKDTYARCTGLYNQPNQLGFKLAAHGGQFLL